MDFRADLHCHSTYSDGSLSPAELVHQAATCGLKGLAITDHDTLGAYEAAQSVAAELNIGLITGAEFSTTHRKKSVHILAYAFIPNHPALLNLCANHALRRRERNLLILEKLAKLAIHLTEADILAQAPHSHSIGRPHIAQALLAKQYVDSFAEAFKRYLGDDKAAYVPGQNFTVEETVATIHQAKGLAMIAHPHLMTHESILGDLFNMNFDGLECFYGRFAAKQNKRWIEIAQKKNWLMTGGSDFHGAMKPQIPLGCSWVNEETFLHLKNQMTHAVS